MVSVAKGYAAWKLANGIGGDDGDPDFDSLINFIEYAFGGDPFSDSSHLLSTVSYEVYDLGAGPQQFFTLGVRRGATTTDFS